ncbi:MAG: GlsB/YeaQ/YmgE family stress response membrane protein [Armatimonadetes bacterium]|nr:GlsB/YeaQ/YmgE family stress response membrane protein [Armatimonadota bacterium]
MLMTIVFWVIVGIIAGALARAVVPSAEGQGGWGTDLIIGLVGALIGGFLFNALLGHSYGGWVGSTVVAFIGAVILLAIVRAFSRRRVV